jgi:hypothetical protein
VRRPVAGGPFDQRAFEDEHESRVRVARADALPGLVRHLGKDEAADAAPADHVAVKRKVLRRPLHRA